MLIDKKIRVPIGRETVKEDLFGALAQAARQRGLRVSNTETLRERVMDLWRPQDTGMEQTSGTRFYIKGLFLTGLIVDIYHLGLQEDKTESIYVTKGALTARELRNYLDAVEGELTRRENARLKYGGVTLANERSRTGGGVSTT
jgi:hypothetical protein